MKKKPEHVNFPGFLHPQSEELNDEGYVRIPLILDQYWCYMSGAEQKVMFFILRRTYGWNKDCDSISWSQFATGLGSEKGTGLSVSQIRRAVSGLEQMGFIKVERHKFRPCVFHLALRKTDDEVIVLEVERKAAKLLNEMVRLGKAKIWFSADDDDDMPEDL